MLPISLSDAKRTKMGESQSKTERPIAVHCKNPVKDAHPAEADTNNKKKTHQMQLEGVRISWASRDKANTRWESCQWVGKGAVQNSPRRGLARGVPIGTTMGEIRENPGTHQSSKQERRTPWGSIHKNRKI